MQRYLSLSFPHWSVERARREQWRQSLRASPLGGRRPNSIRDELASSFGPLPSGQAGWRTAPETPPVASAAPAASPPSTTRASQHAGATSGWRHPRTMAAAWTTARVEHGGRQQGADRSVVAPGRGQEPPWTASRRPAVVVRIEHGVRVVVDACPRSLLLGVRPGMTLAHARALCATADGHRPGPVADDAEPCELFDHDPVADVAGLRKLAGWLLRHVPTVAVDPPNGLLADVAGCGRLIAQRYGSEDGLLQFLFTTLRGFGLTARSAIADTVGAAWGLAHHGQHPLVVVAPGETAEAIRPLPIESLRLAPAAVESLRRVEVARVGELMNLDRTELAERFARVRRGGLGGSAAGGLGAARRSASHPAASGTEFGEGEVLVPGLATMVPAEGRQSSTRSAGAAGLAGQRVASVPDPIERLDQALGLLPETICPVRIAPSCRVEAHFSGPVVDRDSLEIALADLVERLCAKLRRLERGVRRLRLTAIRSDAAPLWNDLHLGQPTRRRSHLWTLLRPTIESLPLGFGIDALLLAAQRTATLRHRQIVTPATQANRFGLPGPASWHERPASVGGDGRPHHLPTGSERSDRRAGAVAFDASVGEFIDAVAARLGLDAVLRAMPLACHEPEASLSLLPVASAGLLAREAMAGARIRDARRSRAMEATDGEEGHVMWPAAERPTILWPQPEPVVIEYARSAAGVATEPCLAEPCLAEPWSGIPSLRAVHWRGERFLVRAEGGFERIVERWWLPGMESKSDTAGDPSRQEADAGTRIYRRVLVMGGPDPFAAPGLWLWLRFDVSTGRWGVQGVWA